MKKLLLFSLCPFLMILFSCHCHQGSNTTSNHNDTVRYNTIKLGIRTVDENGNDLPNFKVKCDIRDYGTVIVDTVSTPFEKCITSTNSIAIIHVLGVEPATFKTFENGFTHDTTIVFVFKRGK